MTMKCTGRERDGVREATFHALRGSQLGGPGLLGGGDAGRRRGAPRGALYLLYVYIAYRSSEVLTTIRVRTYLLLGDVGWGDGPPTAARFRSGRAQVDR